MKDTKLPTITLQCTAVRRDTHRPLQPDIKYSPQFTNVSIAITRQVNRVYRDKIVGRFALLSLTTRQQEHLHHSTQYLTQ